MIIIQMLVSLCLYLMKHLSWNTCRESLVSPPIWTKRASATTSLLVTLSKRVTRTIERIFTQNLFWNNGQKRVEITRYPRITNVNNSLLCGFHNKFGFHFLPVTELRHNVSISLRKLDFLSYTIIFIVQFYSFTFLTVFFSFFYESCFVYHGVFGVNW
jgi:hypothetical protein